MAFYRNMLVLCAAIAGLCGAANARMQCNRTPLAVQTPPPPEPTFSCPVASDGNWWSGCYGGTGATTCTGIKNSKSCGCKDLESEFRISGSNYGTVIDCGCGSNDQGTKVEIQWLCSEDFGSDLGSGGGVQPPTSTHPVRTPGKFCWCQLKLQDSELVGSWVDNNPATGYNDLDNCKTYCAHFCAYRVSTVPSFRASLCP